MATQGRSPDLDHALSSHSQRNGSKEAELKPIQDDEIWSDDEEGEEDGPKRKRARPLSVSCELCKTRKVRCDRGKPSCGWCVRNEQVCEYRERKKPGLRAGYGRELEARLDRLEGVIEQQQQLLQQVARILPELASQSNQQSPAAHTTSRPADYETRSDPAMYRQRPTTHTGDTSLGQASSPFGSLPALMPHPSQMQSDHLQRQPHHASMRTPANALYAASDPPLASPSLSIPGSHQAGANFVQTIAQQDADLPPYDLLYSLVDLFFKHVNTWAPILHRRSTLDSLFGSSSLDESDRILLHAIVATTLRFSNDMRLTDDSRARYHLNSKQKVLLYGMENSSVKTLQALVILALDVVGDSNGPPGWNLLALITRGVVQLGLAVETTSASISPLYPSIYTLRAMVLPEPADWIEDESRRRLFWMVYLLDRYATIATAFEFALDEKEIDRKLPCRDDLFSRNQPVETRWFRTADRTDYTTNKPENLGSFSYYVEIVGLLSRIHRFLKKPVDISALSDVEKWQREYRELDTTLNSWKFSLPSDYGNMARVFNPNGGNKAVNCVWVMLHITYHTAVIRLHSSAAYPTTRSPIFTPSFSASQRCQTAVEDICSLCTYVRNNNMIIDLGPHFAFSLWVAARLLLVHGSTIDHKLSPAIYLLVETLRDMGSQWKVAGRYATLLQRVLDEYSDSERGPAGANGERVTPSTVKILADMRRCAYDLDFLISRQPRHQQPARIVNAPPAKPPAPNELEYLDVFDFFNMPRLPATVDAALTDFQADLGPGGDFMSYDVNADWFMQNPGS